MKTIFKYPLTVTDYQVVEMPVGSKILAVKVQHGYPCLWAEVDTIKKKEERAFEIIGTGNPMPSLDMGVERKYIGTFLDGNFVWHLYERIWS